MSQLLAIDRPLSIELFAGSFGWSAGWLAAGGRAIGFDIEHLPHHGPIPAGAELVLQDVLTLHGSQFRNASLIVASPPCTEYSYMAMPWSRAKQIAKALIGKTVYEAPLFGLREEEHHTFPERYRGSVTPEQLKRLFDACFRIQREACEAAGRYIPLVVENVKGAQPWVGRAKANYGSYYLWGDVESVGGRIVRSGPVQFGMPAVKAAARDMKRNPDGTDHPQGSWFKIADSKERGAQKQPGRNFHFPEKYGIPSPSFHGADHEPSVAAAAKLTNGSKNNGGSWFGVAHNTESGHGQNPVNGLKLCKKSIRSNARRAASALIARIPRPLSDHIARIFWPAEAEGRQVLEVLNNAR